MATTEHPDHFENLISNMKEVDRLSEIHSEITTPGPGRKYAVEILHKSGIVLLVACWEAFVEDLAKTALLYMIENAKDHKAFPDNVLERISSNHQGKKAWALAGDGWKKVLVDNYEGVLAKTTGKLNTPKTEQVDELFLKTIGLDSISLKWSWSGRSSDKSQQELDDLVTLRGSIAHRVSSATAVHNRHVENSRNFIARLSVKSHNAVNAYINSRIKSTPWGTYSFGATR